MQARTVKIGCVVKVTLCTADCCGPLFDELNCRTKTTPFCNEIVGYCGDSENHRNAQPSTKYDWREEESPTTNQATATPKTTAFPNKVRADAIDENTIGNGGSAAGDPAANSTSGAGAGTSNGNTGGTARTGMSRGSLAGIIIALILGAAFAFWWCKYRLKNGTAAAAAAAAKAEMEAAEDQRNTFQMEANPLARRQAGNSTVNTNSHRTVVTSTTANPTFNAQQSDGARATTVEYLEPNRDQINVYDDAQEERRGSTEADASYAVVVDNRPGRVTLELDPSGYVLDTSINREPNAPIEYAVPAEMETVSTVEDGYIPPFPNYAVVGAAPERNVDSPVLDNIEYAVPVLDGVRSVHSLDDGYALPFPKYALPGAMHIATEVDAAGTTGNGNPEEQCTYKGGACNARQSATGGLFCEKHSCIACGGPKRAGESQCKPCAAKTRADVHV